MRHSETGIFQKRSYENPVRCPMDAIKQFLQNRPFAPIYLDEAPIDDLYEYRFVGKLQSKGAEFVMSVVLVDDCRLSIIFPQVLFDFVLGVAEDVTVTFLVLSKRFFQNISLC